MTQANLVKIIFYHANKRRDTRMKYDVIIIGAGPGGILLLMS